MKTALAVVVLVVTALAGAARADDVDPRVLFADRNYAAAATIFEMRYLADGGTNDGINAVVAWRSAGRYAHARALLAQVAPQVAAGDRAAPHIQQLEEKLARLTGTALLVGMPRARDVIVKVDGQLPERLGELILLDVGEHTLTVERELCQAYSWRGVVLPADALRLEVALRCDRSGTLHVTLVASSKERKRTIMIDGAPLVTKESFDRSQELDAKLAPGRHRIRIESRKRLVADDVVEVVPQRTVSRRFRYPWRAQELPFGARLASIAGVSRAGSLLGAGVGLGMDGSWAAIFCDLGVGARDASGRTGVWFGAEVAFHVFRRPFWQARRGGAVLALDLDPLAVRLDATSTPSTGLAGIVRSTNYYSVTAARFTVEWPPMQLQVTLWPLVYAVASNNLAGSEDEVSGLGAAVNVTLGWHQ